MEEKTVVTNESGTVGKVEDVNQDYIAAIKELKEKTVSVEKFNQLQEQNKQLLQTLVDGGQITTTVAEQPKDLDELRTDLFLGDNSNLQYVQKSLALRDELIKQGQPDPYLPMGKNISPTQQDIDAAEKVATVFKECIQYADGDSALFTQELQRRTIDVRIPVRR